GRVKDDRVYEFAMSSDFVPFRRDISYVKCTAAPIQPLIPGLSFIKDPVRWGYPLRTGLVEITRKDFELIAGAMGAQIDA
ncbi:MAG TPA: EVE domain-containing protein, partial [Spirochaetia bacterium]|nr:EVE domain-containing protein [Spirochaetia bacterium]